jgi:hypothetical protein
MIEGSPYVLTIGDIGVTGDGQVVTPNGAGPLKGSQWIMHDQTVRTTGIPTYAIVLAIVFASACGLGLLFLLMKEERVSGFVTVNVRTGKLTHTTQIPATGTQTYPQVSALVSHAQTLAAAA